MGSPLGGPNACPHCHHRRLLPHHPAAKIQPAGCRAADACQDALPAAPCSVPVRPLFPLQHSGRNHLAARINRDVSLYDSKHFGHFRGVPIELFGCDFQGASGGGFVTAQHTQNTAMHPTSQPTSPLPSRCHWGRGDGTADSTPPC